MVTRTDENSRFYNYPDVSISTLLDNEIPPHQIPKEVMPLWQALYAAELRGDYMGTDQIPTDPSGGDRALTDDEVEALHQEAMRDAAPVDTVFDQVDEQKSANAGGQGSAAHSTAASSVGGSLPPPTQPPPLPPR